MWRSWSASRRRWIVNKPIPDSYMTIEGQRYRVYWCDETHQFESEPVDPEPTTAPIQPTPAPIPAKQAVAPLSTTSPIRIISSGCGIQSFVMQELLHQGLLKFDAVIHVNVGDDSENPATIAYKNE